MQEVDKKKTQRQSLSFSVFFSFRAKVFTWHSQFVELCFSRESASLLRLLRFYDVLCYQKVLFSISVHKSHQGLPIWAQYEQPHITLWMLLGRAHLQFALLIRKGLASHLDMSGSGATHEPLNELAKGPNKIKYAHVYCFFVLQKYSCNTLK